MRKLIFFIGLFLPVLSQAQVNLVHNGSFEQYSTCPSGYDAIKRALFWQTIDSVSASPECAPEYCNACADKVTSGVNVPYGSAYYHYARTGDGMVESNMYFDNSYSETLQRNYTQGKLYDHLVAGTNYCVTFYVTLAQRSGYANNKIGAYLDNGRIDSGQHSTDCGLVQPVVPQVFGTTIINDTLNWVKIQGSFIADGTERFITIGNFFDADHTDTVKLHYPHSSGPISFYLIDDVSVIESNAVANAGADTHGGVGDTVRIGTNEEGMPCTWYVLGDTTPVGYGGGIKVRHSATGTYQYVVMLDLCGHVTYDTMTLSIWPAGVAIPQSFSDLKLYPNPATNELNVEGVKNCEVVFFDVVGREIYHSVITSEKQELDISAMHSGVFFVQITDNLTGVRILRKVQKE